MMRGTRCRLFEARIGSGNRLALVGRGKQMLVVPRHRYGPTRLGRHSPRVPRTIFKNSERWKTGV